MDGDLLMEERNEVMVSPAGGQVCVRRGHFLKPVATSAPAPAPATSCAAAARFDEYKDLPLKITYQGCYLPPEKWIAWVDQMQKLHSSTWVKSGIVDAIINSKCVLHRYKDLVFGFVEKWCETTNSFVFPWGEATVTLEDVMVLGGYPVLGLGILNLTASDDEEIEQVVKKLNESRSILMKTSARNPYCSKWLSRFMGSGSEIEHEAFLTYWLSRFVFPLKRSIIRKDVIPIAVRLARGFKIALAPAVLSTIYNSLSMLKSAMAASRKSKRDQNKTVDQVSVPSLSLLHAWIWERYPLLRPKPNPIGSKPCLARWHNLNSKYRSLMIDSIGEGFQWRPYATMEGKPGIIYKDDEQWVDAGSDLDEDLVLFVTCLRTSEFVALDCDSVQQYLPHRVGMQFGFDQDIPGAEIAWSDYNRPIRDGKIYIPSRHSKPFVTVRYSKWLKRLNIGCSGEDLEVQVEKKEFADDVLPPQTKREFDNDNDVVCSPPGFSQNRKRDEDKNNVVRLSIGCSGKSEKKKFVVDDVLPPQMKRREFDNDNDVVGSPPGFPQKRKRDAYKNNKVQLSSEWSSKREKQEFAVDILRPQTKRGEFDDDVVGLAPVFSQKRKMDEDKNNGVQLLSDWSGKREKQEFAVDDVLPPQTNRREFDNGYDFVFSPHGFPQNRKRDEDKNNEVQLLSGWNVKWEIQKFAVDDVLSPKTERREFDNHNDDVASPPALSQKRKMDEDKNNGVQLLSDWSSKREKQLGKMFLVERKDRIDEETVKSRKLGKELIERMRHIEKLVHLLKAGL